MPRLARMLERVLLVVACLALGYYGYASAEAYLYQTWENRQLDAILAGVPDVATSDTDDSSPAAVAGVSRIRSQPTRGSTLGRLEIARLGVSTMVRAGSDARTLSLAVGHIEGTALPGASGNVGLAGHRDTFFRRLDGIRPEDEIRLVTPEGTYIYRVEHTLVVDPRDVWVLDSTEDAVLTLVTCYPFAYVGPAPRRFIVRAVQVSMTESAMSSLNSSTRLMSSEHDSAIVPVRSLANDTTPIEFIGLLLERGTSTIG